MNNVKVDWRIQVAYYRKFIFVIICTILAAVFFIVSYGINTATNIGLIESSYNLIINPVFRGLTCLMYFLAAIISLYKLSFKRRTKHYLFFAFIALCFVEEIAVCFSLLAAMIIAFVALAFYFASCFLFKKIIWKRVPYVLIFYVFIFLLINLLFALKVFEQNILYWVIANFYGLLLFSNLAYAVSIFISVKDKHSLIPLLAIIFFSISDLLWMFVFFLPASGVLLNSLVFFGMLSNYCSMFMNAFNLQKMLYFN